MARGCGGSTRLLGARAGASPPVPRVLTAQSRVDEDQVSGAPGCLYHCLSPAALCFGFLKGEVEEAQQR